jgi:hypothetical protein
MPYVTIKYLFEKVIFEVAVGKFTLSKVLAVYVDRCGGFRFGWKN